ncbi:MAG: hypothetical protein JNK82_27665, partial [Myxococcaceae bacterium]|nr:hypothetical protein [Myxococcaceae bacterium]
KPAASSGAPEPAPAAAVTIDKAAPSRRSPVIAFSLGGVGLGALIAGGVVMGLAFSGKSSIEGSYTTDGEGNVVSTLRRSDLDARASTVNTQFVLSTVVGSVGAVLLATAIALLIAS